MLLFFPVHTLKKDKPFMPHKALSFLKRKYGLFIWRHYLPCTVLCRNPLVLATFDQEFLTNTPAFLDAFVKSRAKSIHVFLQLGWEHETPKNALPFAEKVKAAMEQCPRLKVTTLANSSNEVRVLTGLGLDCILCNHNALVDERRYPIIKSEKKYDALYIARITPFKRHLLAKQISSLHLIGEISYRDSEQEYNDYILHDQLKHATWTRHVNGKDIPAAIAEARCGLCLSQAEGGMFASVEYLLCGIPVVNTKNLGGRDELFPDFAVKTVPDTPEAVAEAVHDFAEHAPDPERIRAATLEKMKPHREAFRSLLNAAMKPKKFPESRRFPHKLLLRCTKTPLALFRYGLRRCKTLGA